MEAILQSNQRVRREGCTTLSSRNQITLPASMVRSQGFKAGMRFLVEDFGDVILLVPDTAETADAPTGSFGTTAEEIGAYIAGERASWNK